MTNDEFLSLGLIRLIRYLMHIKTFPTSIKAASIVSGIPEQEIPRVLKGTAFEVIYDVIIVQEVSKVG